MKILKTYWVTFALLLVAAVLTAAPGLYNSLFAPVEWYSVPSAFFRSVTNPGSVIPVMASDGYRLPVDASLSSGTTLVIPASTKIGILGTFTISLNANTTTSLPAAPTGATNCVLNPTQIVNYGGVGLASGVGPNFFYANVPGQGFYGYSVFTGFRMIPQTTVATATGYWE